MSTQFSGFGSLLIVFLIICACVFCYIRVWRSRNRRLQQNEQRRAHSMVYSVTMQDGNGSSFYNSVTEYLRNSQTSQDDSELTTRQRQLNDNFINGKMKPKGLPTYDDVISGKFDGNTEPPPPYSEAGNLEPTSSPSDSVRYI